MDRPAAWELLCEYTKNENLRKHALAVEACARRAGGIAGERSGQTQEPLGMPPLVCPGGSQMGSVRRKSMASKPVVLG